MSEGFEYKQIMLIKSLDVELIESTGLTMFLSNYIQYFNNKKRAYSRHQLVEVTIKQSVLILY